MSGNQQDPDIMCEVFILAPTDLVDDDELPLDRGSTVAPDYQVRDSAPRFACITEPDGSGAVWIHLSGELDMHTTPQLVWTLSEPLLVQAPLVVLDLRDLAFIDSAGLEAIVQANARARRRERRVLVVRGSPTVHRIFTLTKAAGDLEILDLEALDPRGDEPG